MKKLLIFLTLIAAHGAWPQVPTFISYQSVLFDASGLVVADGAYSMTFRLYDAETGGGELWSETQSVTTANGVFSAALGSATSLGLAFDRAYWLGLSVEGGAEMSPRVQLTASPYSLMAKSVEDGAVTSAKIADSGIATGDLADDAVTSGKIADGTVSAGDLASGAAVKSVNGLTDAVTFSAGSNVTLSTSGNTLTIAATGTELPDGAVTSAKIADGTVAAADLAPGAAVKSVNGLMDAVTLSAGSNVAIAASGNTLTISATGTELPDGAVTSVKLLDGAVTSAKIVDGTVAAADLAPGAAVKSVNGLMDAVTLSAGSNVAIAASGNTLTISATGTELPDGAVTSAKIADGAIGDADISATAAISTAKISGLGSAALLGVGTVAGSVVQLDGSGRLPAVDGSQLTGVVATPGLGSVGSSQLVDGSVTSAKITDGTIDASDLSSGAAVKSVNGLTDAVTLSAGSNVTITPSGNALTIAATSSLADGSVTAVKLAGDAVTSAKIADGGIATADVADNAITTGKIADGTVVAADLSSGAAVKSVNGLTDAVTLTAGSNVTITPSGNTLTIAATGTVLSDGIVTSAKIADGTIVAGDLADGAVTSAKIADAAIIAADLADASVTSEKIVDDTIADADISSSAAISASKIAGLGSAAVLTAGTAAGNVVQLDGSGRLPAVDGSQLTGVSATPTDGSVTGAKLGSNAVTGGKIADGTIVAGDLADGAVTSAKIADGTIVAGDLADGAVTSAKIADGTVSAGDLASGAAVKSINSLTDAVTLTAGSNVTITPSGNALTIAAASGNTLDQAYDQGGSGSGRTITADNGAVSIAGLDGLVVSGTGGSGSIPATGAGTRLMFYPNKSAFRAGYVSSTQWDDGNIGTQSTVAGGYNNTASGSRSTIGGGSSNSAGNYATVSGGNAGSASGDYSAVGGGDTNVASGSSSTAAGGNQNTASGGFSAVGGGANNSAASGYSTVAGGTNNNANTNNYTTVGGGRKNTASGLSAVISGGESSAASGQSATVGGGNNNIASSNYSTIGGGQDNIADGLGATVPGGMLNHAGGDYSFAAGRRAKAYHAGAFVWGDQTDADLTSTAVDQFLIRASGGVGIGTASPSQPLTVAGTVYSTSGGFKFPDGTTQTTAAAGGGNTLDQAYDQGGAGAGRTITANNGAVAIAGTDGLVSSGTVGSGSIPATGAGTRLMWYPKKAAFRAGNVSSTQWDDASIGNYSTVAGGVNNTASGQYSTVGGGWSNTVANLRATISGGGSNSVGGDYGTVAGGNGNTANGNTATIGGGNANTAAGDYGTVSGGRTNSASSSYSAVGGGQNNTASGQWATIPGGRLNAATGNYSFAAGNRAKANHAGAFVWGDQTAADFASTAVDQFLIRASGGVGIGTSSPGAAFHVVSPAAAPAIFDRTADDGAIIELRQNGTPEGTISVSGTTISYNAFTGSHFAWTDAAIERGMLVSLTGINRNLNGNPDSELLYGVVVSATANDPKILGAYLGLSEPARAAGPENPHLVMAVGNGDMWIVDSGEDIEIGDYLISADVKGHAMKDQGQFEISYVVARAAEPVKWDRVSETIDGRKHEKISIFFESFVCNHALARTQDELKQTKAELGKLQTRMADLITAVERLEKLGVEKGQRLENAALQQQNKQLKAQMMEMRTQQSSTAPESMMDE